MTEAPKPAKLVHITDIHFGDANPAVLEAALHAFEAIKPDCIVITGDFTQAGRRREFAEAVAWLARIEAPIVATPGNHDAPVYNLSARLLYPYKRYGKMGLLERWRSEDGVCAIATVNTARAIQARADWSQGVFNLRELREAHEWAIAAAPMGWRLVACHHPPVTPAGARVNSRTRRGEAAVATLAGDPRGVFLSGHVHGHFETRDATTGLRMVSAPSLASARDRGAGNGFLVLEAGAGSLSTHPWRYIDGGFAEAPAGPRGSVAGPPGGEG